MGVRADLRRPQVLRGDDEVIARLGQFADSVRRAYAKRRPHTSPWGVGMLRACLFYEQRNWCKWGKAMAEVTREDAKYFVSLAEAIRGRLG